MTLGSAGLESSLIGMEARVGVVKKSISLSPDNFVVS